MRLRAAVRAEVAGPESAAHLVLELTAAVPEEAQSIEYGLALTGEGEAAIDSVAVEAVSPIND